MRLNTWSRGLASLSTYRRKAELIRFGVVIPVHDEELRILQSLEALDRAMAAVADLTVEVGIAIVLDRCSDRSGELVEEWRRGAAGRDDTGMIEISSGDGRRQCRPGQLASWAVDPYSSIGLTWPQPASGYPTTDADSEVPSDWISSRS